ncbi:hypothetical protein CEUSTIGMA_g13339.t1 [Chlamydomonas eustigma]|uniref:Uncharacterized protein n=1 Tax=Chlamydomonas eustigma TaxID=1157962 RepID=A0A250XSC3_9CHLO|nr:hypothetical protein CEUSTIGMA_g13339.t1 [Chlamydomonas eustigma]|eukprot:GAX85923.1 hypothetical protein CEUSTIGMA_g13339.t1 [Chlamydomonas eustigma]
MKRKLESNGSGLVDLVQRAYDGGFLHQHKALQEFLTDVINAVMGGRQSRVLSATSKEIYSTILYFCGQMAHDWVSKVFLGPSISTTRNIKATIDYPCVLGLHSTFFDVAARLMNAWGLIEAPFILSEDGSALQMRVDICSQGGEAHVFGFSGSSMTVKSLQEFTVLARERTVASTLYAYTLVPLIDGAPSFPLFSIGHDNGSSSTFSTQLAWSIWMYVWQELSARGVRLIGYTHDGDRRLVNAGHQLCRYPPDLYAGEESNSNVLIDETPQSVLPIQSRKARPAPIWLDHPVLPPYKIFAQTAGLRSFIHIMDNVDSLHKMWRVKNQFLQPHRRLDFGGLLITPSYLQRNKELLGLSDADLDHKNKQDMRGMEKVFDFCRQSAKSRPLGENDTILQVPDYRKRPHVMVETDIVRENVRSSGAENYGLYMFLEFGHRYLRMFLERRPIDIVKDAAFCIMFIAFWRRDIDIRARASAADTNGPRTARYDSNCLTSQTCHDIVFTCTGLILSVKLLREQFPSTKIDFSRFSSGFSEYFFQALRSCTKTSNKVNSSQYCQIVKGVIMSLMREAQSTTGLPVMQSKRGMAKSELRISEDWNKAGADYWPSDTLMLSAIDGEFEEIKQILSLPLCSEQNMDVHNLWTHEWVLPGGKGARVRGSKKARHGTSKDPQTMCLGMTKEDISENLTKPYLEGIKVGANGHICMSD